MTAFRVIPSFRRAVLFAAFAALLLPTLPAKEEVLLDFTEVRRDPDKRIYKCYEYSFGDWGNKKVIDLPGKGALIQAPGGKGGLGENKTLLKLNKFQVLEVTYIIGNANQAGTINFGVTDKDGTEQSWSIPLAGLAKGADQRFRFDLTKPSAEPKPGKTPGLDLAHLDSWQVRGDWGAAKVEVLVVRISGIKK